MRIAASRAFNFPELLGPGIERLMQLVALHAGVRDVDDYRVPYGRGSAIGFVQMTRLPRVNFLVELMAYRVRVKIVRIKRALHPKEERPKVDLHLGALVPGKPLDLPKYDRVPPE